MYDSNKDAGVCPLGIEMQYSRFSMLVSSLDLRSRNFCEQIHRSVRYSEPSITGPLHFKESSLWPVGT